MPHPQTTHREKQQLLAVAYSVLPVSPRIRSSAHYPAHSAPIIMKRKKRQRSHSHASLSSLTRSRATMSASSTAWSSSGHVVATESLHTCTSNNCSIASFVLRPRVLRILLRYHRIRHVNKSCGYKEIQWHILPKSKIHKKLKSGGAGPLEVGRVLVKYSSSVLIKHACRQCSLSRQ